MKRLLPFLPVVLVIALVAQASPGVNLIPRVSSGPSLSLTQSAPTANPNPESYLPGVGNQGQSASVPGALHLAGCSNYQLCVYADAGPNGSQLNAAAGGGQQYQIWYWPENPVDAGSLNLWAQNSALTEVPTLSGVSQECFQGHSSTGLGWIYVVPNKIASLQPADAGVDAGGVIPRVEATCAN